jgi:hypothetical protein
MTTAGAFIVKSKAAWVANLSNRQENRAAKQRRSVNHKEEFVRLARR